jgi:hypothetical protein
VFFCVLGVRTLPLFVPFNAFPRLLTPFGALLNDSLSGVESFLRVFKGATTSPIRRTGKQNPLNPSGFYALILGPKMKLKIL